MLKKMRNEGNIDRLFRVLFGAVLVLLVFVGPKTAWGLLGFIPLLTGAFGYCPMYHLLGVETCPSEPQGREST